MHYVPSASMNIFSSYIAITPPQSTSTNIPLQSTAISHTQIVKRLSSKYRKNRRLSRGSKLREMWVKILVFFFKKWFKIIVLEKWSPKMHQPSPLAWYLRVFNSVQGGEFSLRWLEGRSAWNGIFTAVGCQRSALDYVLQNLADLLFYSQAPVQRQHSSSASTNGCAFIFIPEFVSFFFLFQGYQI